MVKTVNFIGAGLRKSVGQTLRIEPAAVQSVLDGTLNVGRQRISDHQSAVCVPIRNMLAHIIEEMGLRFLAADFFRDKIVKKIRIKAAFLETAALISGVSVGNDVKPMGFA